MTPTKSQLDKMTKFPNEMLWDMLNKASHYPDKNISWLEKCNRILENKTKTTTSFGQRLEILREVDHCLANYVQLYFDKGLKIPEDQKYWYDVCLEVRKMIMS